MAETDMAEIDMAAGRARGRRARQLTGRKVLAITVGFFGVIFVVNFFMAWSAIHTFPGLDLDPSEDNGYVASQHFDAERKAQLALGWNVATRVEPADLRLEITGPDGLPAAVRSIKASIGRPTERSDDQVLAFAETSSGAHVAPITPLGPGKWEFRLRAIAADGTLFHQNIDLFVPEP